MGRQKGLDLEGVVIIQDLMGNCSVDMTLLINHLSCSRNHRKELAGTMACKCPIHGDRSSGTGDNMPNGCHQHLVTTAIGNKDRLRLPSLGETVR